jgi:hypothetical protein
MVQRQPIGFRHDSTVPGARCARRAKNHLASSESIPARHAAVRVPANRSYNCPVVATRNQLYNAVVHVFDPRNPSPVLPELFFVIGCHEPRKPVAVLVVSGNDVSSHFPWSRCRDLMRGVSVLASDSGYQPRSGMLPLARSPGRSN